MISDVVTLIAVVRTQNSIGDWVRSERYNEVYCKMDSVSRDEWYSAGRLGLKAQYRFTIALADYGGEEILEYKGTRYAVYRTYNVNNDHIELYVERQVGV